VGAWSFPSRKFLNYKFISKLKIPWTKWSLNPRRPQTTHSCEKHHSTFMQDLHLILVRVSKLDNMCISWKGFFPYVSGAYKTGLKHLERLGLQNKDRIEVSPQLNNMFSNWVIGSQTWISPMYCWTNCLKRIFTSTFSTFSRTEKLTWSLVSPSPGNRLLATVLRVF
jgi:hypothetical protein